MAVTITGLTSSTTLVAGYNVNTINISTSVSGGVRCELYVKTQQMTDPYIIDLTPNNNNDFEFNFEGIIRDIANGVDEYEEPTFTYPDISTLSNSVITDTDVCTYVEYWLKIFDDAGVSIDEILDTSPESLYFLKASRQILKSTLMEEYSREIGYTTNKFYPLLPNVNKIVVWEDYPFELCFDSLRSGTVNQFISVDNTSLFFGTSNGEKENRIKRLVLIDELGNEVTNISNNGSNDLEILLTSGEKVEIEIDYRINDGCGNYFRFKNLEGGTSYWYFSDGYAYTLDRENKKNIERNYTDLSEAKSRLIPIGVDNYNTLTVEETTQNDYEVATLDSLLISNVVELYHKDKKKWQRVSLKNTSQKKKSKDLNSNKYVFDFDLGKIFN